ncbi:MAG: hypothetical protein DRR16_29280 [Candidatus Parabeggiatoa sp. nov. 3]|nr:MAG: hypothetical protein DRR00_29515 [Gammaproteobacteria bacterium]RKZ59421.1 MAG: hypothetical protein DRQ99_23765 [Gammaproteobacteria bacterium]RKZ77631.1 MAG: hypothetical protein DRR16_29280 [Gammaproteobacteria bacterium]
MNVHQRKSGHNQLNQVFGGQLILFIKIPILGKYMKSSIYNFIGNNNSIRAHSQKKVIKSLKKGK